MYVLMKEIFQIGLLIILIISSLFEISAQDIHFSQFYNNSLQINPANAGASNGDFRASTSYRNQWNSVSSPYTTFNVNYDQIVKRNKNSFGGVGVEFYSDKSGSSQLSTNQLNISLSGNLQIGEKSRLAAGLMTGYVDRSIDVDHLAWGAQYQNGYDPSLPSGEHLNSVGFNYFDVGTGMQWFYNKDELTKTMNTQNLKISAGIALFHMHKPNYSFIGNNKERLNMKVILNGNLQYNFANTPWAIIPRFLYEKQGSNEEFVIGSQMKWQLVESTKHTGILDQRALYVGGFIRMKDAIVFMLGLDYAKMHLEISYDVNISSLSIASNKNGGFEISFSYVGIFSSGNLKQNQARFL